NKLVALRAYAARLWVTGGPTVRTALSNEIAPLIRDLEDALDAHETAHERWDAGRRGVHLGGLLETDQKLHHLRAAILHLGNVPVVERAEQADEAVRRP